VRGAAIPLLRGFFMCHEDAPLLARSHPKDARIVIARGSSAHSTDLDPDSSDRPPRPSAVRNQSPSSAPCSPWTRSFRPFIQRETSPGTVVLRNVRRTCPSRSVPATPHPPATAPALTGGHTPLSWFRPAYHELWHREVRLGRDQDNRRSFGRDAHLVIRDPGGTGPSSGGGTASRRQRRIRRHWLSDSTAAGGWSLKHVATGLAAAREHLGPRSPPRRVPRRLASQLSDHGHAGARRFGPSTAALLPPNARHNSVATRHASANDRSAGHPRAPAPGAPRPAAVRSPRATRARDPPLTSSGASTHVVIPARADWKRLPNAPSSSIGPSAHGRRSLRLEDTRDRSASASIHEVLRALRRPVEHARRSGTLWPCRYNVTGDADRGRDACRQSSTPSPILARGGVCVPDPPVDADGSTTTSSSSVSRRRAPPDLVDERAVRGLVDIGRRERRVPTRLVRAPATCITRMTAACTRSSR
jgi:hypothetical protein